MKKNSAGRRQAKHKQLLLLVLLLVLPLTFLGLFYLYPLARICLLSFAPPPGLAGGTGGSAATVLSKLTSPVYLHILWFTVWQATLSTLLTVLLGLPAAWVFARFTFRGKQLLETLLTIPFVLPTVVTAAAFQALLGNGGLVNSWLMSVFNLNSPLIKIEQSLTFFLLAHIFYNYSLVVRIVGGFWRNLSPSLNEAATMLGASPRRCFFHITLPQLLPALGSAALLIFIFCFTSFGIILILGGPANATIEVEIYRQSVQLFNLPMAAALSLVQIVFNFALMWLHGVMSRKSNVGFMATSSSPHSGAARPPRTIGERLAVRANISVMIFLLLAPLLGLLLRSITTNDGFSLRYYTALFTTDRGSVFFVPPIQAVANSLGFAAAAAMLGLLLGLLAALFLSRTRNRWSGLWDGLLMLPLATSAVTLGFGYIISLNRPPFNLRDSLLLVIFAHTLVAFPFVVRCILPSMRQIPQNVREAATLLGAGPFKVWLKVDLALLVKPLLIAAVFAFSVSMGEFGASAFVTRPQTPTLPVAIFRFLGRPGEMNFGQAMAMSCVLMAVTCSAFWLLSRFENK